MRLNWIVRSVLRSRIGEHITCRREPHSPVPLPASGDFTECEPDFSGVIELETEFNAAEPMPRYLEFDWVAASAELFVNGRSAGLRAFAPWIFRLPPLRPGRNRLKLVVSNPLGNEWRARYPEMKKTGQTNSYAERIASFHARTKPGSASARRRSFTSERHKFIGDYPQNDFSPGNVPITDSEMEKPAIDVVLKRTAVIHTPRESLQMAEWVLPALWLGLFGELALSSEISGTNYALIAGPDRPPNRARLASHRPNPLHSFDGSFRSILILDHAGPLACAPDTAGHKTAQPLAHSPGTVDAALTVLASFY
ncbi:MAG: hypothetical protein V8T86_11330 [Victivallis sp.]